MIRLAGGWAIDADPNGGFTLGMPYISKVKDQKTGEMVDRQLWKNATYPLSINGAFKSYRRRMQKELIANNDMTITQALDAFAELDKKLIAEVPEYGFIMKKEGTKND